MVFEVPGCEALEPNRVSSLDMCLTPTPKTVEFLI